MADPFDPTVDLEQNETDLELENLTPIEGSLRNPRREFEVIYCLDSSGNEHSFGPFDDLEVENGIRLIHLHVCHGVSAVELASRGECGYTAEYSVHNAMTVASAALRMKKYSRRPAAAERLHQLGIYPRLPDGHCNHVRTWGNSKDWDNFRR